MMVFPSLPVYIDPPNWNQQHQQQGVVTITTAGGGGGGSIVIGQHHPQLSSGTTTSAPAPVVPSTAVEAGGASGSSSSSVARAGSMAERARLAKAAQPEPALRCPRCDSTNTKFCYYNNYSLSQPRHFCKTCRRYWTRGGALRNVPVGGGCRRNKRTKPAAAAGNNNSASSKPSGVVITTSATGGSDVSPMLTNTSAANETLPDHHLPFLTPLHPVNADLGNGSITSLGLSYSNDSTGTWLNQQMQKFPFYGGIGQCNTMEGTQSTVPATTYFDLEGGGGLGQAALDTGLISHLGSLKMEINHPNILSLPIQNLGSVQNLGNNFWSTGGSGLGGSNDSIIGGRRIDGGWITEFSGLNSSSSPGNLL